MGARLTCHVRPRCLCQRHGASTRPLDPREQVRGIHLPSILDNQVLYGLRYLQNLHSYKSETQEVSSSHVYNWVVCQEKPGISHP